MAERRTLGLIGIIAAGLVAAVAGRLALPEGHAQAPTVPRQGGPRPDVPLAAPPPPPASGDFRQTPEDGASRPPTGVAEPRMLAIDALRARANAGEVEAMVELAHRLMQGIGLPRDQQAGAGWLLRAARQGSAAAAFDVGQLYERGLVVERDPARAVEWYRKAAAAGLPLAQYNLGLMLREGRGAAADGKAAVELLRAASRQGMAAAMFALGDLYERGDGVAGDPVAALAWFAIALAFERQGGARGDDSPLARAASQRLHALQRQLSPADLTRAREIGQSEFRQIVATLDPTGAAQGAPPTGPATGATPAAPFAALPPAETSQGLPPPALPPLRPPAPPAAAAEAAGWPAAAEDQVRLVQRLLVEVSLMTEPPDGILGPVTRRAIRSFQRLVGLAETGEATPEVFLALRAAQAANRRAAPRSD